MAARGTWERDPLAFRDGRRGRLSRRALIAAGLGVSAACLPGCSQRHESELVFHQSKPEAIPFFRRQAKAYGEQHPEISVSHDTSPNLSAAFVRNSPPDVGLKNYNFEMARFMEHGALSDLSDMPDMAAIRPDVRALLDQFPSYQGRSSVIPYSVMAAGCIYNRQIFRQHGLDVPTTWSELIAVCEALTRAGITPFYATLAEPWTISQGWFDYAVGAMLDVGSLFRELKALGPRVSPRSEPSFSRTLREPVERMLALLRYANADAASRSYGDGNTAMAHGAAAMYLQGPWALGEIAKVGTGVSLGTFPLPFTQDADDRRVRVHIDLGLWIPEAAAHREAARAFATHLMSSDIRYRYNAEQLGFNTTVGAPAVTDPRIVELQEFFDRGRFYQGASQFIPLTIPTVNYLQAITLGADIDATLARLDNDWARLASRQGVS